MDKTLIGKKLDNKYLILDVLGEGGLGAVYKAKQEDLDRIVALKILHGSQPVSEDSQLRFKREARVLSNLHHRNIVGVYTFGFLDDNKPYMVMEYIEGITLNQLLQTDPDQKTLLDIFIQICTGTSHAHENGIIHRDLKPPNIMILDEGRKKLVKILDFGLSRLVQGSFDPEQKLTQTGVLIGSIHYMSPETCAGQKADARSDIYSLGCMLYECLAGHPPLEADNPIAILHKHINQMPEPLPKNISESLRSVTFKCLQKSPGDRFQNIKELEKALILINEERDDELDIGKVRILPANKQRVFLFSLCIASITCLILASGFFVLNNQSRTPDGYVSHRKDVLSTRWANIKRAEQLSRSAKQYAESGKNSLAKQAIRRALLSLANHYNEEQKTIEPAKADLLVLVSLVPVMKQVGPIPGEFDIQKLETIIRENDERILANKDLSEFLIALSKISIIQGKFYTALGLMASAIDPLISTRDFKRAAELIDSVDALHFVSKEKTDELPICKEIYINLARAQLMHAQNEDEKAKSLLAMVERKIAALKWADKLLLIDFYFKAAKQELDLDNYKKAESLNLKGLVLAQEIQKANPDRVCNFLQALTEVYLSSNQLDKAKTTLNDFDSYLNSMDERRIEKRFVDFLSSNRVRLQQLKQKNKS